MTLRTRMIWGFIAALLIGVGALVAQQNPSGAAKPILYSQVVREAEQHRIESVSIKGDEISGLDRSGVRFTTVSPMLNDGVLVRLESEGVKVEAQTPRPSLVFGLIQAILPLLLLAGLWLLILRQLQGRAAVGFGRFKVRLQPDPGSPRVLEPNSEVAALHRRIGVRPCTSGISNPGFGTSASPWIGRPWTSRRSRRTRSRPMPTHPAHPDRRALRRQVHARPAPVFRPAGAATRPVGPC